MPADGSTPVKFNGNSEYISTPYNKLFKFWPMSKLDKYKHLWERDRQLYVLLELEGLNLPSIYDPNNHSMLMIDDDFEILHIIVEKMREAGVKIFYNFEDLYKKYPPITPEERRRRMEEFKPPNLN